MFIKIKDGSYLKLSAIDALEVQPPYVQVISGLDDREIKPRVNFIIRDRSFIAQEFETIDLCNDYVGEVISLIEGDT